MIPKRWLRESRHVGQLFDSRRPRASKLSPGLAGCATGRTTNLSADRSQMGQIDQGRSGWEPVTQNPRPPRLTRHLMDRCLGSPTEGLRELVDEKRAADQV